MTNYDPADRRITIMFLRKRVRPGNDDGAFRYELLKYVKVRDNVDVAGEPQTFFEPITASMFTDFSTVNAGRDLGWFSDFEKIEILDSHPSECTRFD